MQLTHLILKHISGNNHHSGNLTETFLGDWNQTLSKVPKIKKLKMMYLEGQEKHL